MLVALGVGCMTGGGHDYEFSGGEYEGLGTETFDSLASNCTLTAPAGATPGSMTVPVKAGETVFITTASDGTFLVNANQANGSPCASPNTYTVAFVESGATGVEKVIIDGVNGWPMVKGTAKNGVTTPGMTLTMGAGSSVKIRGTAQNDKLICGSTYTGNTLNGSWCNVDGDAVADIKLTGVNNVVVSGGPGDDVLSGGGGSGTGNALDRTIGFAAYGGAGKDTLTGGATDNAPGGGGASVLNGGAGDDIFKQTALVAPDNMIGGPGNDTVDYSARSVSINVTICTTCQPNTCIGAVDTCTPCDTAQTTCNNGCMTADTTCTTGCTDTQTTCNGDCDTTQATCSTGCSDTQASCSSSCSDTLTNALLACPPGNNPCTQAAVDASTACDDACSSAQTSCDAQCTTDQTTCHSTCDGTATSCSAGCASTFSSCGAACDATHTTCRSTCTDTLTGCTVGNCSTCLQDDGAAGEGDTVNDDIEIVAGGSGNDTLSASGAPCSPDGVVHKCTLQGNAGNDVLMGSSYSDVLAGGAGIDTVDYSDRTTTVKVSLDAAHLWVTGQNGGTGENDTLTDIENLRGGKGNDFLRGNAGANIIWGGDGDDVIEGGAGNDQLFGENGNDTLYGGAGNDILTGGAGVDTFYGGDGDDLIDATDGVADVVDCDGYNDSSATTAGTSPGSQDLLVGDSHDPSPGTNCEL
jgi:Ca2+-binding RTX toxin-like protein